MIGNIAYPEMLFIGGMFALVFGAGFILLVCVMISRWRTASPITKLHYITILIFFVGALNFLCGIGIVETGFMGGTALHGKIERGQFYLGEGGEYISVPPSTFLICKYYEITVLLLTFVLSPIVACITYYMQEEPRETLSSKVINEVIKKGKHK